VPIKSICHHSFSKISSIALGVKCLLNDNMVRLTADLITSLLFIGDTFGKIVRLNIIFFSFLGSVRQL
jgi:hypothetical protein